MYGVYFIAIALSSIHAYKKPEYNWDMLPYMALAIKSQSGDSAQLHEMTYQLAKENVPAAAYGLLVDTSNPYRKRTFTNPEIFYNQFPLYAVKPLYIGFVKLFYKAGFPLSTATYLPSILAYFLVGGLLLFWLQKYLRLLYAVIASLLIMMSPPLLNIARVSAPDGLSALLLFGSMYCILERRAIWPAFVLLVLSIFARIDNIVAATFILSFLAFTSKWELKIRLRNYFLMLAVLVVSYLIVTYSVREYGWGLLYYDHFFRYLNLSHDYHSSFSLKEFLQVLYSHGIVGLYYSNFIICLFLILLILMSGKGIRWKYLDFEQSLVACIFLIILLRFILYPDISDRFNTAYYLVVYAVFLKRYSRLISAAA